MEIAVGAPAVNIALLPRQATGASELQTLRKHLMETQVRVGDIEVRIGQLRDQQARLNGSERLQLNKPIADAQHDFAVASVDRDATRERIQELQATQHTGSTIVVPSSEPLVGQRQVEKLGVGIFLLMLPIVFAMSRWVWNRSGPRVQVMPGADLSSRIGRIEEAVESIAVEVERIGEGQRFTTKLLAERQPDAVAPVARREPGTTTPH